MHGGGEYSGESLPAGSSSRFIPSGNQCIIKLDNGRFETPYLLSETYQGFGMNPPKTSHELSSAMEDYLEAIYHLEKDRRIARVRDIAKRLGVKMSSVTSALRSLASRGLIRYDPHQYISLTSAGLETARVIVRKHEVLKRFLVRVLQVDESAAEDNACRIEHHLDPEVIEKLVRFVEFMAT